MIRRYIEGEGAYLEVVLNSVIDGGELDQLHAPAASPPEITLHLHSHSTALRTSSHRNCRVQTEANLITNWATAGVILFLSWIIGYVIAQASMIASNSVVYCASHPLQPRWARTCTRVILPIRPQTKGTYFLFRPRQCQMHRNHSIWPTVLVLN